ncbi:hypothetical protein [Streptomyces antarcticus]|uniref:hypothetical protein n=1 Tax=Streptomyces antarcticus TaxID=2996458 RepID=UPI00226DC1A3|nr:MULTISPECIES: hypothetical protein [unclassified Streptomyces]MCY0942217.1 hypothetical protein [Streptomyces sp. H34-AA3]MCZ4083197.1 hypothetical protein [Streptomyces sp. H34-S5]
MGSKITPAQAVLSADRNADRETETEEPTETSEVKGNVAAFFAAGNKSMMGGWTE